MDPTAQLSPHFQFGEMTITDHRDYILQNQVLAANFLDNGRQLAAKLEEVRDFLSQKFGRDVPIVIHSAFRCQELNQAIGGALHSQHCLFEAADCVFPGLTLAEVYNSIAFDSLIEFGQIIYEFASWVHISIRDPAKYPEAVSQKLRADSVAGSTVYAFVTEPIA